MRIDRRGRVNERRKKRMILPAIYSILEMVFMWLALSLIHLSFDFRAWSVLGYLVFIAFMLYSVGKTIHVYRRQKNYPDV